MEELFRTKIRYLSGIVLLIAIFLISNGCNKSSVYGTTGTTTDTGGTGGPGVNQVFIEAMAFNPVTIQVSVNATVTWTNKDAIGHTVTSDAGVFDSGTIASNGIYSYTFTTAGTYTYHCKIHPDMVGSVVVSPPAPGY